MSEKPRIQTNSRTKRRMSRWSEMPMWISDQVIKDLDMAKRRARRRATPRGGVSSGCSKTSARPAHPADFEDYDIGRG